MRHFLLILFFLLVGNMAVAAWGFFAHKKINRHAVFSLPPEMIGFFKSNIQFITENAVNPDRRRYAVFGEAEKHYLDADIYGDSAVYTLPRYWQQAVEKFGEEELRKHGIGPWNAYNTKNQLTEAFKRKDKKAILRLAADLGHYIGDINVPLHTTKNYNGQLTNQYGIHAFWESRIPELLSEDYDLLVGQAEYISNTQLAAWDAIIFAHLALDSVLHFEKILSDKFPEDRKYSFEERAGINTRVYSKEFTKAYHDMLSGQVERQMKRSIKMIADFWYSAWIDAGQPVLNDLLDKPLEDLEEIYPIPSSPLNVRDHETIANKESPEELRRSFFRSMWRTGD
ncbi:zinc dependent phospholipase C family protein [Belliella kenyensis]|uniref:Zinc dependent phospholipase C family protein n=1 Tax=Belliella kenyensis TaxID=1472724 RepID=A0ABV8EJW9_9BACT|nr:zinc dependent phospholipase C family protein [Belliella kenyensis]MCH7403481.1 zinc dependent phospholipase C family protein [Belliella kenyensis]MDN3602381.1 zinc dependent phospholipase C family protein [Belliella kenyensis]